jgi:hypothetical protein
MCPLLPVNHLTVHLTVAGVETYLAHRDGDRSARGEIDDFLVPSGNIQNLVDLGARRSRNAVKARMR